jgi:putative cell wall-binding protein/peptidoglycan/xylan/chitin deacetylase (PgdA/CDA1 family)
MATLLAVLGSFGAVVGMALPAQAATPTVVSVTFDDGNADQLAAAQTMAAKGLKGTFYIISGVVGQENYLTQAEVGTIAGLGHEIGGHTVGHVDLATKDAAEATRQVCNDRATLTGWGYKVTSFAYPFASQNAQAQQVVKDCGYNSARGLGDLKTAPGTPCADCAVAETIPPANPYLTAAADQVTSTWTLDDMKKWVTDAEAAGGGWVQLTFHHVCETGNTCGFSPDDPTTTTALFNDFTTWLAAWQDGSTKQVKTVDEVIGGAVAAPPAAAPITPPAAAGVNGVVNPGLDVAADGQTTCWYNNSYLEPLTATNTPVFSNVTPGRTGTGSASKIVMTNYSGGDAKKLQTFDGSECSPTVVEGHTYSLRAWYKSTVPTQFAVHYRNAAGVWKYETASPFFPASATYTQAVWTTPVVPAGASGISFGLNIMANGELETDDYELFDTNGAPALSLSTATPVITGTPQVGQQLTAATGTWGPDPVTLAVQWLANGVDIPGATGSAYTPVADNAGKVLTVRVSGTKEGYAPQAVSSAATAAVAPATVVPTPVVAREGGADRFATSALVSASFPTNAPVAYIASGANYPDALAGAAAAGFRGGPVLLVLKDEIPAVISAELTRLSPESIVVLGGTDVISNSVQSTLGGFAATTRVGGADRFETSALVSSNTFGTNVPVAYVASGSNYPDALAGAAVAGANRGPVLLVHQNEIPAVVAAELSRLNPQRIVVLGGTTVISSAVQTSLGTIATTSRLGGADRFETSAAVSASTFAPGVPVVYVASGSNYPDALSGAAAAGSKGGPVLLVHQNEIPASVAAELDRLNPARIVVLGGTTVISDAVQSSLQGYLQ